MAPSRSPRVLTELPAPGAADERDPGVGPLRWWSSAWRWARRHPLVTVLVFGLVQAVVGAVWIWTNRRLGSFDPDEAGYLATALRYQRSIDPAHPMAFVREVASTTNGPLVPILSLPFLIAGPRDPRAAMLVQPLLAALTGVAAAGITRRLAGATAAVVVGLFVVALPTMLLAAGSYWYGLGAAACMTGALWALLASERLSNRWRWAFGLCCGLMLLARTMSLGFLPGLLLAGLVLAWGDRGRLLGWVEAVVVTGIVAGPWWIARREEIFDYLVGYAYGSRAALWGTGGPVERLLDRALLVSWSSFLLPIIPLAVVAVAWGARTAMERRPWRPPWTDGVRAVAATAVVVVLGFVALVSTSNRGVWFELPLVVAMIPLGAAIVARGRPLPRRLLAAWMLGVALIAPVAVRVAGIGHADGALVRYDERFTAGPTQQRRASDEWRALNEAVTADLAELTDRGRNGSVWVTGNMFLLNTNSLTLTAELDGWSATLGVPDTLAGSTARAAQLTPQVGGVERILVVVRHDLELFTPDLRWRSFERQALGTGWREVERFPLPVEGEVVVLRHQDALAAE